MTLHQVAKESKDSLNCMRLEVIYYKDKYNKWDFSRTYPLTRESILEVAKKAKNGIFFSIESNVYTTLKDIKTAIQSTYNLYKNDINAGTEILNYYLKWLEEEETARKNSNRDYVLITNRHKSFSGGLLFWGEYTKDNEQRNFSGYTDDLDTCEKYSLSDVSVDYPIFSDRRGKNYWFAQDDFLIRLDQLYLLGIKLKITAERA